MTHNTDTWLDHLGTEVRPHYRPDGAEVFHLDPAHPVFARLTFDDQTAIVTLLSNDRAQLIHGQARLSNLPASVLGATITAMVTA